MNRYPIAIAGSTEHIVQSAQALISSGLFEVTWVLTPSPRPQGRKQVLTPNPLHLFAEQTNLPVVLIDQTIDESTQKRIQALNHSGQIDFLLVVDFGYLIPDWLLRLPKVAPINIHPSALPKWRGSSPGQFSLLYGDPTSAVSVMVMDEGLDTGPLLKQLSFAIQPTWTQTEYYQHSFDLVNTQLAPIIADFAAGQITAQPQLISSPTPIARRLSRPDGFIEWQFLTQVMKGNEKMTAEANTQTSALLQEVVKSGIDWRATIEQAVRAFNPWPLVWTIIPTTKGPKRMQIHEVQLINQNLELKKVKVEGQDLTSWLQAKNQVSS